MRNAIWKRLGDAEKGIFHTRPTPALLHPPLPELAKTSSLPADVPFPGFVLGSTKFSTYPPGKEPVWAGLGRAGDTGTPAVLSRLRPLAGKDVSRHVRGGRV